MLVALLARPTPSCCVCWSEVWALAAKPSKGCRILNKDRELPGGHASRAFPGSAALISTLPGHCAPDRSLSLPETCAGRDTSHPADLLRVQEASKCQCFWAQPGALAGQGEASGSVSCYWAPSVPPSTAVWALGSPGGCSPSPCA